MDHSERMLRQQIEALPDGTYEARGDARRVPRPPRSGLPQPDRARRRDGRRLRHPDRPDRHLARRSTCRSTCRSSGPSTSRSTSPCARCCSTPRVHDAVSTNAGLFRPVTITAPEGTLANPRFPAPTIARFCTGNIVADTLMRALAPVLPESVAAGVGNLKVTAFSGAAGDAAWVYMDIMEGSYGGRHGRDGMDAVDTLYANTRNNPIEDIESHYPLRVRRYELVDRPARARGRWRGGLGSIREFEFLADGGFSLEGDGSSVPPPGLFGGGDGAPGSVVMNPGTPREQELPSKIPYRKVTRRRAAATRRAVRRRLRRSRRPRSAGVPARRRGRPARRMSRRQRRRPVWRRRGARGRRRDRRRPRAAASRGSPGPPSCSRSPSASRQSSGGSGSTVEIDAAGNLIAKWDGPSDRGGDGRLAPRHGPARRPVRRRARGAGGRRGGPPAAGGGLPSVAPDLDRVVHGRGGHPVRQPRCSAAARSAARTCRPRWTPATGTGSRSATRWPRTGTPAGPARRGQSGRPGRSVSRAAYRAGSGAVVRRRPGGGCRCDLRGRRDEGRAPGRVQPRRHDADGHAPRRAGGGGRGRARAARAAPPTATSCGRPSAGSRSRPGVAT